MLAQVTNWENLLDRMTNADKDFRFMATNDLMSELQKENIEWDDESEIKIIHQIIGLLKDKNGEVQNLAVKCLGFLISKIKDEHRQIVIKSLCQMIRHEKEEIRDISSMALKTIVPEIPINKKMIDIVNNDLNPNLLNAIANSNDVNVQLESLEILAELINRVGSRLTAYHDKMQEELIKQLSSDRSAVRKRSMNALSNLLASCSDELFDSTISQLYDALSELASESSTGNISQNSTTINTIKTLLQCVATIIRFAGHRSNMNQLKEIIPVICKFCQVDDDELREHSLQAFESYVKRCPINITEALPDIMKICLDNIAYDPNYNYIDDDDDLMDYEVMDVEETSANGIENDDDDSLDDYSDDDDLSWKVRRASARCLEAIINAKRDLAEEFLQSVAPVLISRFKEREESVKADIIQTFVSLLKQTRLLVHAQKNAHAIIDKLRQMIPEIVIKSNALWRDKFLKTRQIALIMFTEIITIIPNGLSNHIHTILSGVLHSLVDKNSSTNMKMDALIFLQELMKAHQPSIFYLQFQNLLPIVLNAVNDTFYRIASEALALLTLIVSVLRPAQGEPMLGYETIYPLIYRKTIDRMSQPGIDLEIKERSMICMGQIISTFGDKMEDELPVAFEMFFERLNNEATRLTTVKALTKVAKSPLDISLDKIFPRAFVTLSSFLRKNSRQLRLSSLILIETVVQRSPKLMDDQSNQIILADVPALISENDLYISQLTFNMLTCLVEKGKFLHKPKTTDDIMMEAFKLIRCPLLQGSALRAVLNFFSKIVEKPPPNWDYPTLLQKLVEPIYEGQSLHKQAFSSTSRVIAATSVGSDSRTVFTTQTLITDSKQFKSDEQALTLILLSLGEIGKLRDLHGAQDLIEVVLEAFDSGSEDVKSAASYALGCLTVGNRDKFLPIILQEIEAKNKRLYLALHSLREVISSGQLQQCDSIWELLMNNCACPEEGTRNVVSECLGKLTLLNPSILLQTLIKHFKEDFPQIPLARSTVIAAIKFTISDQPQPFDDLLRQHIGEFLIGLQDSDIEVRRSALILFNSAAHNKPSLIIDLLPSILPLLYQETKLKPDLIRQVEMGPFKHQVDDGLDSRKAAFECMYTLLDSCQNHLNIMEFLTHVEDGLKDHYDIKMLTYLMLNKLVSICPSIVLQRLDQLLAPIIDVCRTRTKENAVKQEHERQEELKRASLKAFHALRSLPNGDGHKSILRFLEDIRVDKHLSDIYSIIHKDSNNTRSESCMNMR